MNAQEQHDMSAIYDILRKQSDTTHDMNTDIARVTALLRSIHSRLDNAAENLDPLKDDKNIVADAMDVITVALMVMPEAFGKYYDKYDGHATEIKNLFHATLMNAEQGKAA